MVGHSRSAMAVAAFGLLLCFTACGGETGAKTVACEGTPTAAGGCLVTLGAGGAGCAIAVDGAHVFWQGQGLMSAGLDGSSPTEIVQGSVDDYGLVADGHNVYWGMEGTVFRRDVAQGVVVELASTPARVRAITVDAANVYWSDVEGGVHSVPIGGTDAVTIAAGAYPNPALGVGPDSIYWGTDEGLMAAPLGGGVPVLLASGSVWDLEVVGEDVVYVDQTAAALMNLPKSGRAPVVLATFFGGEMPFWLDVDADNAYLATRAAIVKVPLDGGDPVPLAGASVPCSLAVDATSVYFTDLFDGLKKITPK
jgi:hypothetical protein